MQSLLRPLSLIAFVCTLAAPVFAGPPDSFAPMVDPLLPAVVNISTTQKVTQQGPAFDIQGIPGNSPQAEQLKKLFQQMNPQLGAPQGEREVTSLGSGFVIDSTGYVVTNNHVVGNAEQITVIFGDNTHLKATIVGRDEKTDLALLKVKTDKPLTAVKWGDSDALHVGDWVVAVGNPFGLGGTVTAGIVSARGRNINAGPFDDFIQTDAAINRGNSGGPLFNTHGEVVGVNSAIFSPNGANIGIGFSVPSAMAKSIIGQLRETGTIHRGWLGVKIAPVTDELANSLGLDHAHGALLSDLNKDGPAGAAGLQPGDVILKFDGHDIDEMHKLPRYVADTKTGKKVDITYWRKGREEIAHATIGTVPLENEGDKIEGKSGKVESNASDQGLILGMKLVPLTKQVRDQLTVRSDVKGVLVDGVDGTGEAAKRGILPGDIIIEVNQAPVETIDGIKDALTAAKKAGREFALVHVLRHNDSLFATVSVK